jgi:hypothetical protein
MADLTLKGLCHFTRDKRLPSKLKLMASGWVVLYPALDLQKEIYQAHLWLLAQEPGYRNMRRFLNHWMRKADEIRKTHETQRWESRRAQENVEKIHQEEKKWKEDISVEEMRQVREKNLGSK